MSKKNTGPSLVIVEWGDAWNASRWTSLEQAEVDHKPYVVKTVGWLLKSDKKGVSLVDSYVEEDMTPGGQHFIPRGMIRKITKVK